MAFIVNDMSCIYTLYNLEIPLRSSASYRETSLCLQRHSGEGLLVWWQALQQVLVLSPHVLPPPLKKSHMTDLTFLSLANIHFRSKVSWNSWLETRFSHLKTQFVWVSRNLHFWIFTTQKGFFSSSSWPTCPNLALWANCLEILVPLCSDHSIQILLNLTWFQMLWK